MDVHLTPAAANSPEAERLRRMAARFPEVIGEANVAGLRVEWDVVRDADDRELYRLTISNADGRAMTDVLPLELTLPLSVRIILSRLWGDILQIRSDKAGERSRRAVAELLASGELD